MLIDYEILGYESTFGFLKRSFVVEKVWSWDLYYIMKTSTKKKNYRNLYINTKGRFAEKIMIIIWRRYLIFHLCVEKKRPVTEVWATQNFIKDKMTRRVDVILRKSARVYWLFRLFQKMSQSILTVSVILCSSNVFGRTSPRWCSRGSPDGWIQILFLQN